MREGERQGETNRQRDKQTDRQKREKDRNKLKAIDSEFLINYIGNDFGSVLV